MKIDDKRLDDLLKEIETVRRRRILDYSNTKDIRFVDPYNYTEKLKVSNNHIILGRRGCGKTTLFLKIIENQKNKQSIIVDCQPIKSKDIDNVLIDILKSIMKYLLDYYEYAWNGLMKSYKSKFGGLKKIKILFNKNHELLIKKKNLENLKLKIELLKYKINKIYELPSTVNINKNTSITKEHKTTKESKKELIPYIRN